MTLKQRRWLQLLGIITVMLAVPIIGHNYLVKPEDPFMTQYRERCAVCHGDRMQGAAQGSALVGADLRGGDSVDELKVSIARGAPERGMPRWDGILKPADITSMALLIAERRQDLDIASLVDEPIIVPGHRFESELHRFRLETFAEDLDPLPYSIAPLPDGSVLLSEKRLGLSIIRADGTRTRIAGGPPTYNDDISLSAVGVGIGWYLDVALHPDYEQNGWIYLHYSDRCKDACNSLAAVSPFPVAMNRVERGRIRDGIWTDRQTIWKAHIDTYNSTPDIIAGGRLTFDDAGHLYLSVGMRSARQDVQDLTLPYGKIHRVNDDGTVPADNPFRVGYEGALPSIWTVGHRSPQGLEFDGPSGLLWGSEMGPRGGDEVNLLQGGANYGWPMISKGVNYDGTPIDGRELRPEFEPPGKLTGPAVDFSPSPAVSSLVVYHGSAFPGFEGHILLTSLKAGALFRIGLDGTRVTDRERLIDGLARIRDIEVDREGLIYLLLESRAGTKIVRMVPD